MFHERCRHRSCKESGKSSAEKKKADNGVGATQLFHVCRHEDGRHDELPSRCAEKAVEQVHREIPAEIPADIFGERFLSVGCVLACIFHNENQFTMGERIATTMPNITDATVFSHSNLRVGPDPKGPCRLGDARPPAGFFCLFAGDPGFRIAEARAQS